MGIQRVKIVYHREMEDAFSRNFTMKHNQEGLQNFYSNGAMPASSLEEKEIKLMPMIVVKCLYSWCREGGENCITTIQKKQLHCSG